MYYDLLLVKLKQNSLPQEARKPTSKEAKGKKFAPIINKCTRSQPGDNISLLGKLPCFLGL
jgi:hypothetical protein